MGSFFHGWRRKTGLLTLMLALILMSGWIRSLSQEEQFSFVAFQKYECFASATGRLEWASWVRDDEFAKAPYPVQFWSQPKRNNSNYFAARTVNSFVGFIRTCFLPAQSAPIPKPTSMWELASIGRGRNVEGVDGRVVRFVAIPYLLIVFPLILFSANLLILKPRSAITFLREFVVGKRRKVGIVTALIALAPASQWIRSFSHEDVIVFKGRSSYNRILSMKGRVGWGRIHPSPKRDLFPYWQSTDVRWDQTPNLTFSEWSHWFNIDNDAGDAQGWTYWGFGVAFDQNKVPGHTLRIWIVPYAFIVVPLLLLSTGFMLPRRASG